MLAQRIGESLRLIFVPDASVIDYASRHNARLAVHLGWDLAALELLWVGRTLNVRCVWKGGG